MGNSMLLLTPRCCCCRPPSMGGCKRLARPEEAQLAGLRNVAERWKLERSVDRMKSHLRSDEEEEEEEVAAATTERVAGRRRRPNEQTANGFGWCGVKVNGKTRCNRPEDGGKVG